MNQFTKEKVLPLSLTAFIILLDQVSKSIIANNYPIGRHNIIADIFGNGFLQIIHVRNPAIAFSLGNNLPEFIKPVVFVILPVLVLGFLVWYFFRSSDFTTLQRWAVAGIIGGGIGNIIDRIFRPSGVVDFIDVKFYGILGMERWPTFNVADSSVVVCCILLFITLLFSLKKSDQETANE